MIAYFDTSALIKLYVEESESEQVIDLWNRTDFVCTNKIAYAEVLSGLYRKNREGTLTMSSLNAAMYEFKSDWVRQLRVIDLHDDVLTLTQSLISQYPLRAFDAIHLSSASWLRDQLPTAEPVLFSCYDKRLNIAAEAVGF